MAICIFPISFISNFIYSYDKNIRPPEIEKIIISLKDDLTPDSKISVSPPLDYFFMFYGTEYGVSIDDWNRDVYTSNNWFIFQNKDSNKGYKAIIDEYFKGKSAHIYGFTEPEVFKDFNLVTVYRMSALKMKISEASVLDYDTIISQGILKNGRLDKNNKEVILDGTTKNILKILQVPINLEQDTDYLITFSIKCKESIDNNIFIDFFGENYDDPAQELSIFPNEMGENYKKFEYVLNSGEIPLNTPIFFRIFTKVSEHFENLQIKNIRISKVLNQ
ncbi:MAG: hypothetical protein ACXWFB_12845 [Nitrososphaeraceae archaeon]